MVQLFDRLAEHFEDLWSDDQFTHEPRPNPAMPDRWPSSLTRGFMLGSSTWAPTPRTYGGVGMAIDGPQTVIDAEAARTFSIVGVEFLDKPTMADIEAAIMRLRSTRTFHPCVSALSPLLTNTLAWERKRHFCYRYSRAIRAEAALTLSESELRTISGPRNFGDWDTYVLHGRSCHRWWPSSR